MSQRRQEKEVIITSSIECCENKTSCRYTPTKMWAETSTPDSKKPHEINRWPGDIETLASWHIPTAQNWPELNGLLTGPTQRVKQSSINSEKSLKKNPSLKILQPIRSDQRFGSEKTNCCDLRATGPHGVERNERKENVRTNRTNASRTFVLARLHTL